MAVESYPGWVGFSIIEIFTLLSISVRDDKLSSVTKKPMWFVAIGFICIVGFITFMFVHCSGYLMITIEHISECKH